ncbi:hypothetical protein J3U87_04515 [Sulfidibacter corallicola]|uniref:DNA binding HTH domain-containing protein n=2 Tax=Sulfidibacter corallicola TaxID=2818388 RepID=A0A8A4TY06_SULCO|nr:hypothetical protein J3U87_04515 [Sulfidibacter corallicola]
MKVGARDFLTKPVSMERLTEVLLGSPEEGPPAKTLEPLEDRDIDDLAVRTSLARNEHEYIEYVLNRCNGNISKAADWLGIHRQSLQRKLKKFPPRR